MSVYILAHTVAHSITHRRQNNGTDKRRVSANNYPPLVSEMELDFHHVTYRPYLRLSVC